LVTIDRREGDSLIVWTDIDDHTWLLGKAHHNMIAMNFEMRPVRVG